MAAFPPPRLDLYVPRPLRDLFRACETVCAAGCCGVDAFAPDPGGVGPWLAADPARGAAALTQFETLLARVAAHRGAVHADADDGCFNAVWQTPHDCLTYLRGWRRAVAGGLRPPSDPFGVDPAWRTGAVAALRDAIAARRHFDRLPILADALEEAGCDRRDLLDHLRAGDDHHDLCWVLDLLADG